MAVVASSTISPAMANNWWNDDDDDDNGLDACFLGTQEVDVVVEEVDVFGNPDFDVLTLDVPCDDDDDHDDDDDWDDDDDHKDWGDHGRFWD